MQEELAYNSADEYDDDLYKGPEDRAKLSVMVEMERELILAERGDKRDSRSDSPFGSNPYICVCVCVCIYRYTDIHIERETAPRPPPPRDAPSERTRQPFLA